MIARAAWLVIALVIGGGCLKTYYVDGKLGYYVTSIEHPRGGARGQLHPSLIEYIFAEQDGPWLAYYGALLARDRGNADLTELEASAREIASGRAPRAVDYARARGRKLAIAINTGLGADGVEPGAVKVRSPRSVDRDTGELDKWFTITELIVHADAKVVRVSWTDPRTNRTLTYDLSRLPAAAFDPRATLSYDEVARRVRPLHPAQRRHY
jgi:hypothetical protein